MIDESLLDYRHKENENYLKKYMAAAEKHALWLRPFGDTAFEIKEQINELSRKYHTPAFEPHITILSGLRHNKTELIQFTDTLAGSLSPFPVKLTQLGFHDNYYQSFFVRVKKNAPFMIVQQTAEKLFGCTTDEEYFPHLSLMYGLDDEEEKRKLVGTIGPYMNISFPVHSLLLIKTEGEVNEWKKIHTAEFRHH